MLHAAAADASGRAVAGAAAETANTASSATVANRPALENKRFRKRGPIAANHIGRAPSVPRLIQGRTVSPALACRQRRRLTARADCATSRPRDGLSPLSCPLICSSLHARAPLAFATVLLVCVLSLGHSRPAEAGCGGVQTATAQHWHKPYRPPLAIGDSTMLLALRSEERRV